MRALVETNEYLWLVVVVKLLSEPCLRLCPPNSETGVATRRICNLANLYAVWWGYCDQGRDVQVVIDSIIDDNLSEEVGLVSPFEPNSTFQDVSLEHRGELCRIARLLMAHRRGLNPEWKAQRQAQLSA